MATKPSASWATRLFLGVLVLTLGVYILRGMAILSMMPGSVIWGLLLLTLVTGLWAALQRLR
ncbi:hypothetical protein GS597_01765 [Synechococcales cyanobacterium C]|uniref:DUF4175 domain-containing protein n=1 Tax=Petrachloros mirabilis ULC683 TaxID=2781853 RepID=A0A8K1ZW90_9CYAN|nr:hypothetical protein [Petrachloros mirabilis]NCJ05262.1 hypothetical protein [Petrachloros mirabilis ULC683]